jgi:hypothetical protein
MGCILMMAALLGGCGGDPQQILQRAASWTAAAEMTGEHWLAGHLPTRYATRTLTRAAKELLDAAGRPGVRPDALRAATTAAETLRAAIDADDRAGARRAVDELTRRARELAQQAQEVRT